MKKSSPAKNTNKCNNGKNICNKKSIEQSDRDFKIHKFRTLKRIK